MEIQIIIEQLRGAGLADEEATDLAQRLLHVLAAGEDEPKTWRRITREILNPALPFAVDRLLFETTYAGWDSARGPAPAWIPTAQEADRTNIARLMAQRGLARYEDLYAWSIRERADFWEAVIGALGIRFRQPWRTMLDLSTGVTAPRWLSGARFNIVESCFGAQPGSAAIRYQRGDSVGAVTVEELEQLTWRVANGLWELGLITGDPVAIAMPMTVAAVAVYLGILAAGCTVVSIADSFAPHEIATRLRITGAKAIFTQDVVIRGSRQYPMYEKIQAAEGPLTVVVPAGQRLAVPLREGDRAWAHFLSKRCEFDPVDRDPDAHINILFSSGTTGEPKAVPWNQTVPIKCAADAWLHQDVQPGDVLAWPTNIGWMMGPWLIFASLINRATMALFYDAPTGRGFCEFVQNAGVTMLGVVPSLVKTWRANGHWHGLDWSRIRLFSSTGECSNEEDMLWLMSRAGYKPVVEYCGGTEIGGGYISGTLMQPAAPATFSTPALGLGIEIRDAEGTLADNGEVFIVPPSIGLSTELLNRNHHGIYYAGTPTAADGTPLRRHGDQIERLPGGYFRGHGRADDTMNLGGIKVSSVEIERALAAVDWVVEAAAIAIDPPGGGPSELIVYVVAAPQAPASIEEQRVTLQQAVRQTLNPLFRIKEVIVTEMLPRTATNKVMRRRLRELYRERRSA